MSEYTITIDCEPYLAQWATHHFGNPVHFPPRSIENRLLRRFLDTTLGNPNQDNRGNLRIVIPYSKEKDPRCGWVYLNLSAKKALHESLMTLFLRNLWNELGDMDNCNCELTTLIYAWLEKHGIEDSCWETIRQKYYRLRKAYADNGVNLTVR